MSDHRSIVWRLRLTPAEMAQVAADAAEAGCSPSVYARRRLLGAVPDRVARPGPRPREAEPATEACPVDCDARHAGRPCECFPGGGE